MTKKRIIIKAKDHIDYVREPMDEHAINELRLRGLDVEVLAEPEIAARQQDEGDSRPGMRSLILDAAERKANDTPRTSATEDERQTVLVVDVHRIAEDIQQRVEICAELHSLGVDVRTPKEKSSRTR